MTQAVKMQKYSLAVLIQLIWATCALAESAIVRLELSRSVDQR